MDALGDAVHNRDRNLATENARNIVRVRSCGILVFHVHLYPIQEVEQAGSEELRAKTKEVVQATIEALGDSGKEAELSRAMDELKDLAQAIALADGVPEGTVRQNQHLRQQLLKASKDISRNVEDIFAPRSERYKHLS